MPETNGYCRRTRASGREFSTLQRKTIGTTRERMLRKLAVVLEGLTAKRLPVLWLEDLPVHRSKSRIRIPRSAFHNPP